MNLHYTQQIFHLPTHKKLFQLPEKKEKLSYFLTFHQVQNILHSFPQDYILLKYKVVSNFHVHPKGTLHLYIASGQILEFEYALELLFLKILSSQNPLYKNLFPSYLDFLHKKISTYHLNFVLILFHLVLQLLVKFQNTYDLNEHLFYSL